MVVQGIGGGSNDMPYMRQGHWRWCEMELCHTAWFARALFELLPPAGGDTPIAVPKNKVNFQMQNSDQLIFYSGISQPVVLPVYAANGHMVKRVHLSCPSGSFATNDLPTARCPRFLPADALHVASALQHLIALAPAVANAGPSRVAR